MRGWLDLADTGSRSLSVFLGLVAVGLAVAVGATSMDPGGIARWTLEMFGVTFLALCGGLVFVCLFAWTRMIQSRHKTAERALWLETGLHAASGVATLALTYTLFGISLGIGTLADQPLNPDTVGGIIQDLTRHFSLAFLTTVVGLPVSALLRAVVQVTDRRLDTFEEIVGNDTPGEVA